MTREQIRKAKKSILRCLIKDFDYGRIKDRKFNQAIFSKKGYAIFHNTDLEMVMDKVVLGLMLLLEEEK